MTAMIKKAEFTQMIDSTLIQTIDDDLVINVGTIKALIPFISQGILERDQLPIILTVLDDATVENRLALHDLLVKANFSDSLSVMHCLKKLLQSLRRFPMDKYSIYSCLGGIGKRHAPMVQAHVSELLEVHPIFDMPEQNIEDDFYLAKLILVLNAASQYPVICSLIPNYILKHYRYLQRAWPSLIPPIKEFEDKKRPLIELPPDVSNSGEKLWTSPGTSRNYNDQNIKSIRIFEPTKEFQNNEIIRFVAGLPTSILVRCLLENVTDEEFERFRFQIEYPDQTIDYCRPRHGDFLRLSPHSVHLQTKIIFSAQRWAIPASIYFIAGICSKNFLHTNVKRMKEIKGNFTPLKCAENLNKDNKISINIHPVLQA
uniref:Integrator complex subunit 4/Protein SIEL C-terminal Ig-like domain-containing protein n=1 Tax=Meloidogyne incognita TaxID=6306 RepID=A0A914KXS7_MELIC